MFQKTTTTPRPDASPAQNTKAISEDVRPIRGDNEGGCLYPEEAILNSGWGSPVGNSTAKMGPSVLVSSTVSLEFCVVIF